VNVRETGTDVVMTTEGLICFILDWDCFLT